MSRRGGKRGRPGRMVARCGLCGAHDAMTVVNVHRSNMVAQSVWAWTSIADCNSTTLRRFLATK
jgi:hypothetical protein